MNQPKQLIRLADKEAALKEKHARDIIHNLEILFRTAVEAKALLTESIADDELTEEEQQLAKDSLAVVKLDIKLYRNKLLNLRLNLLNNARPPEEDKHSDS